MHELSLIHIWKCTASVTSENLVHMPSRAEHHIQNTAPGPPMAIAPATPAMLPVQMCIRDRL